METLTFIQTKSDELEKLSENLRYIRSDNFNNPDTAMRARDYIKGTYDLIYKLGEAKAHLPTFNSRFAEKSLYFYLKVNVIEELEKARELIKKAHNFFINGNADFITNKAEILAANVDLEQELYNCIDNARHTRPEHTTTSNPSKINYESLIDKVKEYFSKLNQNTKKGIIKEFDDFMRDMHPFINNLEDKLVTKPRTQGVKAFYTFEYFSHRDINALSNDNLKLIVDNARIVLGEVLKILKDTAREQPGEPPAQDDNLKAEQQFIIDKIEEWLKKNPNKLPRHKDIVTMEGLNYTVKSFINKLAKIKIYEAIIPENQDKHKFKPLCEEIRRRMKLKS
jgi:hypothetical protein